MDDVYEKLTRTLAKDHPLLHEAVIALEHGAREIWTHDRNFVSVPTVKIRDPL